MTAVKFLVRLRGSDVARALAVAMRTVWRRASVCVAPSPIRTGSVIRPERGGKRGAAQ